MTFKDWSHGHQSVGLVAVAISVVVALTLADNSGMPFWPSLAITTLTSMVLCVVITRGAWWLASDGRKSLKRY